MAKVFQVPIAQVLSNNNPLYSYYMFDFRGYDANGASTYTQADGTAGPLATASKDVLDKQALPTMNLGLSTSLNMGDWTIATSLYGSFGHYVYNNTDNAYFFKGAYPVRNIPLESAVSAQWHPQIRIHPQPNTWKKEISFVYPI